MNQFSLSEFNALVKSTLNKHLSPSYWIVAEIGEMNIAQKGHCYMELVEKEGNMVKARSRANIWSYAFAGIQQQFERVAGIPLKKGMQVLVNASLEYHEVYGISLNIKDIDPNFTLGEKERRKQQTISQLTEEGIIDLNKSLILPIVPQRIAIISSETAAGYGDFIDQITNNPFGYVIQTQLFHSLMQGDQASSSITDALHRIFEIEDQFDLAIIIRGGGAQMDLDCFDDFELCSHIAQFPLPVITGIGHERDHTIADMVANVNLKTPTAVAEFLINGLADYESKITEAHLSIKRKVETTIAEHKEYLNQQKYSLNHLSNQRINSEKLKLNSIENRLVSSPISVIKRQRQILEGIKMFIAANDPKYVLKKGYSLTKVNGQYLNDKTAVKTGDLLETTTQTQTIISKAE
ncbi:MAG: exodeoxyribonuclease VII large subunit [Reichenbachiella sp.]